MNMQNVIALQTGAVHLPFGVFLFSCFISLHESKYFKQHGTEKYWAIV